ncbi:type VII secretion system-associated protein [Streptomyces sp. OM5714]|uniref:type VII secretion system-associated protein n=1 Tax=Streptomyces sp. OM5714 TaxID=2602736 RepID=UPI0013DB637B|nr:type VII secretion system-associated protein [Streptomyces sp. OM5714]KAF2775030.1 ADP-ribosylglycohydrolase [Streptomyces sp. OM5714]
MSDDAASTTTADNPSDYTGPDVPDDIKEAARLAPDHWLGMVDPTWSGEGTPPDWATLGEWKSGPDGEIEEWRANETYRPSPRALDWPEATDPVDEAIQLAATGYGPGEDVPRALVAADIAVLLAPGGGPLSATTPNGEAVVPAFTSPPHLQACGRLGYELMPAVDVLDLVPEGHLLYLNASGAVSMTVDVDAFRRAIEDIAAEEHAAAESDTGGAEEAPPPVPDRPSTVGADVDAASGGAMPREGDGAPADGVTAGVEAGGDPVGDPGEDSAPGTASAG